MQQSALVTSTDGNMSSGPRRRRALARESGRLSMGWSMPSTDGNMSSWPRGRRALARESGMTSTDRNVPWRGAHESPPWVVSWGVMGCWCMAVPDGDVSWEIERGRVGKYPPVPWQAWRVGPLMVVGSAGAGVKQCQKAGSAQERHEKSRERSQEDKAAHRSY